MVIDLNITLITVHISYNKMLAFKGIWDPYVRMPVGKHLSIHIFLRIIIHQIILSESCWMFWTRSPGENELS